MLISKPAELLQSFVKAFMKLANRFSDILVPLHANRMEGQETADATISSFRALLSFLHQSIGFSSYVMHGSVNLSRFDNICKPSVVNSPMFELMIVLLCLTDQHFTDNPTLSTELDTTGRFHSGSYCRETEYSVRCLDIAQDYITRLSVRLSDLMPAKISQIGKVAGSAEEPIRESRHRDLILKVLQIQLLISFVDICGKVADSDENGAHCVESSAAGGPHPSSSTELIGGLPRQYLRLLRRLNQQIYAYMPLLTMPVRSALLFCCLGTRFDLAITILKQPPVFDSKDELKLRFTDDGDEKQSNRKEVDNLTSLAALSRNKNVVSNITDTVVHNAVAPGGDQSIIHFYKMNRIEAIQVSLTI
jgi:hypothetical protein